MIMPNSMSATPVQQSMIMNNFANFNNSISQPQFQGPWTITAQEHQQNEEQFMILHPSNGLIGGEQARPFFLKSGLPSNVLAQIWQISDLNKDGKLDRLEFTIAMKLVKNCLAGLPLPPTLPDSMRQISGMTSSYFGGSVPPAPFGNFPSSNGGGAAMPMPPRPLSTHGSMPSIASSSQRSYGSYSAAPTPTGVGGAPPFLMGIKELGDWSMPQPLKLRFSQQFNQLDRSRIGLLTGQQARGVLGESQLPTHILAQIWNMSDVNKDGCLSIEEFCIAKFLIEMVKNGYALPPKLPNELYAFCHRSKTASPSTVGLSEAADPNAPPPQKPGHGQFKSFEDKRRDNLDKGQAELERRRQILREEEERRHAEIERREREEAERKERERQELERRREAEMEAERQREMIRERERAVEEDRLKAEREETRRRLEQERIRELEKIRIRDLENQLQAETEKSTQIQQRHRTMAFQLQALDERSQQLNGEITEARNTILGITQEIEGMRGQRDQKMARIGELERGSKEIIVQSERFSHENLQLQSEFQRQLSRVNEIDTLRREIGELDETIQIAEEQKEAIKERSKNQEKLVTEKRPDWDQSCQGIQNVENVYMELLGKYNLARTAAGAAPTPQTAAPNGAYEMPPDAVFGSIACRRTSQTGSAAGGFDNDFNSDFSTFGRPSLEREASLDKIDLQPLASMNGGAPNAAKQPIQANNEQPGLNTSAVKTVKYRALFEFNARSNDELTLQPGDVVLVFEGHQSEPGWLAGQIRDKVGWFPAAFAEPMSLGTNRAQEPLKKGASLTGSPSGEPLASIKEEGEMPSLTPGAIVTEPKIEERAQFKADFTSAFSKSISLNDTTPAGIDAQLKPMGSMSTSISAAGALYDLPPTEEPIAQKTIENAATNSSGDRIQAASGPMYELPPGDDGKVVTNETTPDEHRVLAVGTALYQWKARNEQEMSFARGDTIEVIEQAEMRWKGRLQKNRKVQGWFPKSYVKLSASASDKLPKTQEQIGNGKQQNGVEHLPFAEGQGAAVCQDNGEWFVALYQFDAVESTDLSLKPGDRIWVIDQRDEWWKGTHGGRTGIFPANYVQKIAEEHQEKVVTMSSTAVEIKHTIGRAIAAFEATASNQISLAPGDIVKVHQTTPGGWWEGELERDGEKHSGWFPGNYIQVLPPEDGKVLATAAFDYAAQHDDELSFKAGEIIEVVERIDSQWWKGKKHGQQDQQVPLLFPANFVQLKSLTP